MKYEKQGYLNEEFRLFHLNDKTKTEFEFHYHEFYKLIIFLKGEVNYYVEGKNYELKPYDYVLIGKNEIHKPVINGDKEYERIVFYISDEFFSNMQWSKVNLKECFELASKSHVNVLRLSVNDNQKIMSIIDKLEKVIKEGEYAKEAFSSIYFAEFMLRFNEIIIKNGISYDGVVAFNEKIVKTTEYINEHLDEDLSIERLSELFFISKYHLMREFKIHTGYTIHKYVLEKRILYTQKLKDDGEKITNACIKAGFKDYSTYLRAKKTMKMRETKDI